MLPYLGADQAKLVTSSGSNVLAELQHAGWAGDEVIPDHRHIQGRAVAERALAIMIISNPGL